MKVRPLAVAASFPFCGRRRLAGIAFEPILYYIVVELLRPEHPGKALTHDILCIGRQILRNDCAVKLISFILTHTEQLIETIESSFGKAGEINIGKTQAYCHAATPRNLDFVMCRGLRYHWHG